MEGVGRRFASRALACAAALGVVAWTAGAAHAAEPPHDHRRELWRERAEDDRGGALGARTLTYRLDETASVTGRPLYLYERTSSDVLASGGCVGAARDGWHSPLADRIGVFVSKKGYAWTASDELLPRYAVHVEVELFDGLYAFVDGSLLTTLSQGGRAPSASNVRDSLERRDLLRFGDDDSDPAITTGLGARYRVGKRFLVGAGVEIPMPGRDDLEGVRMLFDLVAQL